MVRVEHGQTVFVDLALDEDEQWGQVRSRLRSQIRKLTREGFSVAWNDWSRYGEFVAIYEQTMRQVAASERYFFGADYFYGLKAALGEEKKVYCASGWPFGCELLNLMFFVQ